MIKENRPNFRLKHAPVILSFFFLSFSLFFSVSLSFCLSFYGAAYGA